MKLASLKSGRDGALVVVSNDLTKMTSAAKVAGNLQQALDNWSELSPQLEALATSLESGEIIGEVFNQEDCCSQVT